MTPIRARRGGMMLLDMMITLMVVAVVFTLIGRFTVSMLRTGRDLADSERRASAVEAAVSQIRRDVLRAGARISATGERIDLGEGVSWQVQDDTLVRQGPTAARSTFGPLPMPVEMSVDGSILRLKLGDAAWSLHPLQLDAGGVP